MVVEGKKEELPSNSNNSGNNSQGKKKNNLNPKNLSVAIDPNREFGLGKDIWGNPSPLPVPRHPRVPAMKDEDPPIITPRATNPLSSIMGLATYGGPHSGPNSV